MRHTGILSALNTLVFLFVMFILITPVKGFESGFDSFESFYDDSPRARIGGFVQYEGVVSTYTEHDTTETREPEAPFRKNELRGGLDFYYGTSGFYFQTDTNLYLLPGIVSEDMSPDWRYADEFSLRRNLTLTSRYAELELREFYVNYESGRLRLRAGNQIYHWGTADAFNHTSYFNPYDLRELFFKDAGEGLKIGVPSLSVLTTFGGDSVEIVIVPVHVPSVTPLTDSYWEIKHSEGPFPIIIEEPEPIGFGISGAGAGVRYYTNLKGLDMHTSLYRGPDRDPAMKPEKTVSEYGEPVSILITPEHEPLTMAGIALSGVYERFIFQFEGAYSPDKTGVIDKKIDSVTYDELDALLPFETDKGHFASYSAGFNYFVPVGGWPGRYSEESLFTLEWSRSIFFDNRFMKPMLSNIVAARIQDRFFTGRLEASITGMFNIDSELALLMPLVSFRFDSGVQLQLMYVCIHAGETGYLSGYGDKNFLSWRIRYEF